MIPLINISNISINTYEPIKTPLTCEAGLQEFLNSSADKINFMSIFLFLTYSVLVYLTIYLLEKKHISTVQYVKTHRFINNIMIVVAVIYFVYALLLA